VLSGEMDDLSEPAFPLRLSELIGQSHRFIVLDLSNVTFCDSAGLGILFGARRQAEKSEAALALACVPPLVRRILQMTGADQVLRI
jgi:anti-anti-sigma factor